jgi:hypothetical protein
MEKLRLELEKLGLNPEPKWILGIDTSWHTHISGQMRESSDDIWDIETWGAVASPRDIAILLGEAAEQIDDAHQEWMENQLMLFKQGDI